MMVSRMQLYCDGPDTNHFPEDGPVDAAIFTPSELRAEAKKAGWGRMQVGAGYDDLCPKCNEVHRKEKLADIRLGRKRG